MAWGTSRDGAPAALGSSAVLYRLWVKNFLLTSDLNLPSFSLKPFPLLLALSSHVKSAPSLLTGSLQAQGGHNEFSPEPPLLRAEQTQLPQPASIGEVLQPFHPSRLGRRRLQEEPAWPMRSTEGSSHRAQSSAAPSGSGLGAEGSHQPSRPARPCRTLGVPSDRPGPPVTHSPGFIPPVSRSSSGAP